MNYLLSYLIIAEIYAGALRSEGIEAEPELLDTVFDKGRQAEVGLKVGRGYSMLFCREAAKLLGGTLRLQPWPGRGTRAEVLLPFRDAGG